MNTIKRWWQVIPQKKDTTTRRNQLQNYIKQQKVFIENCFSKTSRFDMAGFSETARDDLKYLYLNFLECEYDMNNDYLDLAFVNFANFLEIIKRLPDKIVELNSFSTLKFQILKGELVIDYNEFDKVEPTYKAARELSDQREKNYKELYKKPRSKKAPNN